MAILTCTQGTREVTEPRRSKWIKYRWKLVRVRNSVLSLEIFASKSFRKFNNTFSYKSFRKISVIYLTPSSAVWRKCRRKQQKNKEDNYFFSHSVHCARSVISFQVLLLVSFLVQYTFPVICKASGLWLSWVIGLYRQTADIIIHNKFLEISGNLFLILNFRKIYNFSGKRYAQLSRCTTLLQIKFTPLVPRLNPVFSGDARIV